MKLFTSDYWKYVYAIILLAGLSWIWLSRAAPGESSGAGIPAAQNGFMAPDFSLQVSSGEVMTLSELRGRPVLVNVWASWCPPCRAEMPALERVYKDYQSKGFLILAVNATDQDDPDLALAYTKSLGLTFPILFDTQGEVSKKYQVHALPSSYFIDAQGIIQDVVVGGPMSAVLLQIRIKELIEQPSQGEP